MDMDLQKYLELSEKQILEYANDGEIYLSTVDKNAGYGVIRYKMKQGKKLLSITSRFKIKFEKVYLITFCSLLDEYRKFEQLSNKILDSFGIE
jgi:hypothetical protein